MKFNTVFTQSPVTDIKLGKGPALPAYRQGTEPTVKGLNPCTGSNKAPTSCDVKQVIFLAGFVTLSSAALTTYY